MGDIKHPFAAGAIVSPVHAATIDVTATQDLQIIKLNPTGVETLDLTLPLKAGTAAVVDLVVGHTIKVHVIQDATGRDITMGNNILAVLLVGVADDEDTITLMWDGANFVGGAWEKVLDAA